VTTHVHHLKYRGSPFYFLDKTLDYSKREAVTGANHESRYRRGPILVDGRSRYWNCGRCRGPAELARPESPWTVVAKQCLSEVKQRGLARWFSDHRWLAVLRPPHFYLHPPRLHYCYYWDLAAAPRCR
jgi:hypothetical protein